MPESYMRSKIEKTTPDVYGLVSVIRKIKKSSKFNV